MSRVFGFVERWFAETEQKPANRGRGKKSQKPEEGRGHFETGLWPTQRDRLDRNMDRLYGKRAPIEAAL